MHEDHREAYPVSPAVKTMFFRVSATKVGVNEEIAILHKGPAWRSAAVSVVSQRRANDGDSLEYGSCHDISPSTATSVN